MVIAIPGPAALLRSILWSTLSSPTCWERPAYLYWKQRMVNVKTNIQTSSSQVQLQFLILKSYYICLHTQFELPCKTFVTSSHFLSFYASHFTIIWDKGQIKFSQNYVQEKDVECKDRYIDIKLLRWTSVCVWKSNYICMHTIFWLPCKTC